MTGPATFGPIVAVFGSRGYPLDAVDYFLEKDLADASGVVSGGARGIDRHGEDSASRRGLSVISYRPWRIMGEQGVSVGYRVHKFINGLDQGEVCEHGLPLVFPDFTAAAKARNWWINRDCQRASVFWDGTSTGTAHSIACAYRFNREIRLHMPGDS